MLQGLTVFFYKILPIVRPILIDLAARLLEETLNHPKVNTDELEKVQQITGVQLKNVIKNTAKNLKERR